jgi:hypothetical protein
MYKLVCSLALKAINLKKKQGFKIQWTCPWSNIGLEKYPSKRKHNKYVLIEMISIFHVHKIFLICKCNKLDIRMPMDQIIIYFVIIATFSCTKHNITLLCGKYM